MLIGSFRILNSVALAALLLGGGGCKPSAKSDTPAAGEAKPSKVGETAATEDTQYLTLTNGRDGTKFRVTIPAEPSVDFGPPDYSGDLDEDVGLSGYSSGVEAINKLATDASGGADAQDIFLAIMADHGGNRSGADAGYTDSGALLLTVWYQREHPGTKFVDAAEALKQSPPDIRKIKKAAHVAGLWIEAFNTGNYNYGEADAGPSARMLTPKRGNADTVVDSDAVGTQGRLGGDRQAPIAHITLSTSLRPLLLLPGIDPRPQIVPRLVGYLARRCQRHGWVTPQREKFLFTHHSIFEPPQLSAGRGDDKVQSVPIG